MPHGARIGIGRMARMNGIGRCERGTARTSVMRAARDRMAGASHRPSHTPASRRDERASRSTRSFGIVYMCWVNVMPVFVAFEPAAAISSACSAMAPAIRYNPHCLLNEA